MLRCGQCFCHNSQRRIAQVRFCNPQLFNTHPAIQASGAVNFYPVRKKVNLNRSSFRMNAVIPVDQGVEDCFAECIYRIFRFIRADAGFLIMVLAFMFRRQKFNASSTISEMVPPIRLLSMNRAES